MRRSLLAILLSAGALVAPALLFPEPGAAQPAEEVGIRLLEAPSARAADPRARQYIIDHLNPTNSITRRFEVTNKTGEQKSIRLYAGSARVEGGHFLADDPGSRNAVVGWTTLEPESLDLGPGSSGEARVSIRVPEGVPSGERYAVIWAELPPSATSSGVTLVNRVGIRIYLSVGQGEEPKSNFIIEEFVAARNDDGRPMMRAVVVNTGGRALDLSGELKLDDGPGSLSAGPFPVELGTTIGPDDRASAVVLLDPELPDGPWEATITIRSGELEKSATATVRFPDEAGESARPVEAKPVTGTAFGRALAVVAGVLLLIALALFFLISKRRGGRKASEEEMAPVATSG